MIFDPKNDWFSSENTEYSNTPITSLVEMPNKKLVFGALGKKIKILMNDVEDSFIKDQKNEDNPEKKIAPSNINITAMMPKEDSSDSEEEEEVEKKEEIVEEVKSESEKLSEFKEEPEQPKSEEKTEVKNKSSTMNVRVI